MDYKEAGVDVEKGRSFVEGIRHWVEKTKRPEVLGQFGGFGSCFQLPSGYQEPILVSGTDGVGTKLKLATQCDRHDTVGIDLVAMCANDILTCGAEPLFFLDYLATGQLNSQQLTDVVAGISRGCQQAGCALIGGETAEMPGFYPPGEYDIAGFCVGIVEKSQMLDGSQVAVGDVAIALASSGIHSNGYSLVRKLLDTHAIDLQSIPPGCTQSLEKILLTPTKIYVKPVLEALRSGLQVRAMAHITGGGLPENLPRCLPSHCSLRIDRRSWRVPPIFDWIAQTGNITTADMFATFNMGVGLVLLVPPSQAQWAIEWFQNWEIPAYVIGEAIAGDGRTIGLD
ncbi:phosphoribosylformylglycinamidine cyclo-ligase [Geitlerinema sp. PCC 9228]|jgi:phosphoribosylformylglycinamidine cyclo-ligase|uniref:phosphoribosylformylglycinamidine cyclo-ligase n=1 Tax=Geitlerinema sp. PCC 9228 TaxID=111611 RepID=UPI0008F9D1CC|nr:phosphoribosylformylglycinamidine cyclo-ligase [Geitlerinema sp. PCC 9228]